MPHFTVTLTQGVPIIHVVVMVSAARQAALLAAHIPVPPPQPIRGLIDTGASHTCVDPTIFQALQLQPTGSVPMHTPSTAGVPMAADTYDVGIAIASTPTALPFIKPNMQVTATELIAVQGFHALIGRDILSQFILSYNGSTQQITLAY